MTRDPPLSSAHANLLLSASWRQRPFLDPSAQPSPQTGRRRRETIFNSIFLFYKLQGQFDSFAKWNTIPIRIIDQNQ